MEYDENGYAAELKEKLVCRFCLSQDDLLSNIYSGKSNAQISLSMQIMSCVSIEVRKKKRIENSKIYEQNPLFMNL